ncbi:MAG TPA: FAD:protein FMN transferase, partial [Polyangiaceae bacterium]|nr:FAD:protein FMN transferase [Polyangiaceae bacterium]
MSRPGELWQKTRLNTGKYGFLLGLALLPACNARAPEKTPESSDAARPNAALAAPAPTSAAAASAPAVASAALATSEPEKVDFQDVAMGTNVHFIAYSNAQANTAQIKSAITQALAEMRRLEGLMSEWRDDSEVGKINLNPDQWVTVGPETFSVIARALEEGKVSRGAFDITFQAMSRVWKFGSAADAEPKVPPKAEIERLRKLVDYRVVELDPARHAVRIPKDHKIGLGGIAKGYIVDRAADVLKQAKVRDFLVQAGGDLFGSGKKPDGSPWVSGIQDPRGPQGTFFASIELTDHAFSTAGDYARSYVIGNRRYHHIIDPHTGYPATASRSVTVWAEDATTADAVDDAVFILGPEGGLKLVEATP